MSTHDAVWAGVELKLQNAAFHLEQMGRVLQPPERSGHSVAMEASGAIIGPDWQRSFYPHFDAFLSAARSAGNIIRCCFGVDEHRELKPFSSLPAEEQARRREFQRQFKPHLQTVNQLLLSTSRNISEHRTGVPPVTVATTGFFGVTYVGGPLTRIPTTETRQIDEPNRPFVPSAHLPVRPFWNDFFIDGQPLFSECQDYLNAAQRLIGEGRRIAAQVHGTKSITPRW
jgi:hypothetical protein